MLSTTGCSGCAWSSDVALPRDPEQMGASVEDDRSGEAPACSSPDPFKLQHILVADIDSGAAKIVVFVDLPKHLLCFIHVRAV